MKKTAQAKSHPDHRDQLKRLARIEGQVRGIARMIEERRYCMDIATQIKAVKAALDRVEMNVLKKHIAHCVTDAARSQDEAVLDDKIQEIVALLGARR